MTQTTTIDAPITILGRSLPRMMVVAASSWISRLTTAAISLVSIGILIQLLGVEHYAIYAVLISISGWFSLVDLGVGESLQNFISESRARGFTSAGHQGAAYLIVLLAAILMLGLLYGFGQWPASVLLQEFVVLSDQQKFNYFFLICSLATLSATGAIIYKVWFAEQRGYLSNILPAVASALGLGGVLTLNLMQASDPLFWALIAINTPLFLLPLLALLRRFGKIFSQARTDLWKHSRQILNRGMSFWLFHASVLVVLHVDYVILARFVDPDQIVVYNIVSKIFLIVSVFYSAVLQAFWPVAAEALVHHDWTGIRKFLNLYFRYGVSLVILFSLAFFLFKDILVGILSPDRPIMIDDTLIALFCLMYLIRMWTDVFAVILQSMNDMKIILLWASIQGLVGLVLQLSFVPLWGIYGTVISLCLSWIMTVGWVLPRRVKERQHHHEAVACKGH
ncbi:MAG: MATE family efflux transporter [Magnetococcus sp. WYHC-3]